MDIADLYQRFLSSTGISTDTREIRGDLFFALKGGHFNGNTFAQKAIEKGVKLAVVDEEEYTSENCFLVWDTLATLQELAWYHRSQLAIPVLALTGSNGKTTTKELIQAVLSKKYKAIATKGNLNNHIGVPLTILSITKEHEIAIVEMGANHLKEIELLCAISQPDVGYITNFGKTHLEGFGGIEGVIKGKSELYDFLRLNAKKALINTNDFVQMEQSKEITNRIFFGSDSRSSYAFELIPNKCSGLLALKYKNHYIKTQLIGEYNFSNVCAAISLGLYYKIPLKEIINAVEEYLPKDNRSQFKETASNKLILDSYNANPSSMEAALKSFDKYKATSKWVILGDMFEMGAYYEEEHKKIFKMALTMDFEKIILVGKAFNKTKNRAIKFRTTKELIKWLKNNKPTKKTILIKGSRGMKLEQAAELL